MESLIGFIVLIVVATPVVLLVVFGAKISALTRRIEWLEREIYRLRPQAPPAPSSPAPPPSAAPAPVATAPGAPKAVGPPPVPAAAAPAAMPAAAPRPATPAGPARPAAPPAPPEPEVRSRAREEWESFVGGKLLNRIGALALVIGIGFFLKYAFDNNWISETVRVLIGAAAGIALLFFGGRFHQKEYHVFAQGLVGAGIAALYLSVFASFNFYHLVSQTAAFGLMSVVTVVAFWQAFRYDSLAISLLAWAGGYLTPFLLSTGVANEVGLFSYIELLQTGLLAVVILRPQWRVLSLFTLAGTYLIFALWYDKDYQPDALAATALFLTLFWVLFHLADLIRMLGGGKDHPIHQAVNALNAIIFTSYLYATVNEAHHDLMGMLVAFIAAAYAVPAAVAARKSPQSNAIRNNILLAVTLFILATAIQFSGFVTVTLWAAEALLLIWCARRWGFRWLTLAAMLFFAVIAAKLFSCDGAFLWPKGESFTLILNKRFLAYAALAASMCASALMVRGGREEKLMSGILHAGWTLLFFVLLTVENVDYFAGIAAAATGNDAALYVEFTRNMTALCIWIVYALALVWSGLRAESPVVLIAGFAVMGSVFLLGTWWGIAFEPVGEFHPIMNVRAGALLFVLIASLLAARWLRGTGMRAADAAQALPILGIAQILFFLVLLTGETRDYFERSLATLHAAGWITDEHRSIENMKQLSLSVLWLVYGMGLMGAGIWRRLRGLRIMAMAILGIAILKIFVYDLAYLQTLYRIFSFMGLGLILLGASYLYQRYKRVLFGEGSPPGAG